VSQAVGALPLGGCCTPALADGGVGASGIAHPAASPWPVDPAPAHAPRTCTAPIPVPPPHLCHPTPGPTPTSHGPAACRVTALLLPCVLPRCCLPRLLLLCRCSRLLVGVVVAVCVTAAAAAAASWPLRVALPALSAAMPCAVTLLFMREHRVALVVVIMAVVGVIVEARGFSALQCHL
jgi:hypothetical protein